MIRNWQPTGRQALLVFGAWVFVLFMANMVGTAFWNWNGSVGLLDFDGGMNAIDASIATGFPAAGTAERSVAIVAHYSESARSFHTLLTLTMDLVLPLLSVGMILAVTFWAVRAFGKRARAIAILVVSILASVYLVGDLGENVFELLLLNGADAALADFLVVFTAVKEFGTAVALLAMLLSVIGGVIARIVRRRRTLEVAA